MDWRNERYVRVYCRDTTNWRRMGWAGQTMALHLLRKLDRAGRLELGGLEPWEAAMLQTGAPREVAEAGVSELLRVGSAVVEGDYLFFPNFKEAQECTKSDALRAKEYRENKKLGNFSAAAIVTNRDGMESQNVTQASQESERRHEPSQTVTDRHSVQCSAVQRSTSAVRDRAGARWTAESQMLEFREAWRRRYAVEPSMGGKHVNGFHSAVVETARVRRVDPGKLFRETLATWLDRPRTAFDARSPYACFCQAWGELLGPAAAEERPVTTQGRFDAAQRALRAAIDAGDEAAIAKLGKESRELEAQLEREKGGRR